MTEPQAIRLLCQMRQITWRESQLWLNGLKLPGDRQGLVDLVFLLQLKGQTDSVH
jgi:hypothetical protein